MVENYVRRRGYLTLGTRLKRIGDRLQADVQQLIDAEGIAVQTGQYPLLAAIDELGPMTVGDLAEALGVSQPGVTRSVGQLTKQGIVTVARGPKDQRTKVVTLTGKGQDLVDQGKSNLWPRIEETLADICGQESSNILDQLDSLESTLQERTLFQRIIHSKNSTLKKSHILDRPIWNSLTTVHATFAAGRGGARRFRDGVSIFAGAEDDSGESLAALADLVPKDGNIFLIQVDPVILPEGIKATMSGEGEQMVLENLKPSGRSPHRIEPLTNADAEDMFALATLTKPGPYLKDTRLLGNFFGVKENGKLIAMAGERFRHPGYTEISGVCTHPDYLGRGLAHDLCVTVAEQILARGETPYLHVFSSNIRAIKVYENLGFKTRRKVNAVMLERA